MSWDEDRCDYFHKGANMRCGGFRKGHEARYPGHPFTEPRHDFIRGRNNACTICNRVESASAHDKPKALSLNLSDKGQAFAGVATIRAAIMDVIDAEDGFGGRWLLYHPDEVIADAQRTDFADAVIARIAELQSPPHEGVKLENLCDKHKRECLPAPTAKTCRMCEVERTATGCQATCGRCHFVFTGSDALERLAAHDRVCRV